MPLTNQLILSYFSAGVGRTVLKRNQKTKNKKKVITSWLLKNYKENETNAIVHYSTSRTCNILPLKHSWDMCCSEIKYVN